MARPTEVEKLLEQLLKEQKNSNEVLEQLTDDSGSRESRESRRPVKSVKPTLFVTGKRASQSDYIAARGAMATEKYTKAYLADLKGQKKKNKKAGVDNKKAEEKKDKAEAKRFKEQINMQEDMIDAINGGFDSMNGEEQSRYDRESKRAASAAKKKLRQEKEDRAKAKEERGFLDKWIGDTKDAFTDKIDEVVTNIDKTTKIKLRKTKAEQQEEAQELRRRSEDMLDKMASTSESQMTRSEKAFAKLIKDNDYNFDGISNDMIDIFEKLGDKLQENDDRFKAKWGKDRDELAKKLNKDFGDILKSENTEQIKEFIAKNKELNDSIQKSIQRDYEAEQELNASFEVFGEGSKAQEKLLNLIMEDSAKQSQTMKDYLDFIRQAHDVEVVEAEEARKQSESNTKAITDASRESTEDIIDVLVDGDESDQDRHLALTDATKTSSAVVVKKMDDTEKKEDERHQETMEAEAEIIDDRKAEFRDNFLKRKHELKIKEESLNTLQLILKKLGVCCVGNGLGKGNSLKNQTKPSGGWLSGVLGMGAGLLLMKKLLPKLMGMKVVKTILSKFGLGKVVGSMVDAFTKLSAKTLLMSTMFGGAIKVFSDIFKGTKTVAEATKASAEALKVAKAAKVAKVVPKAAEALKVAKVVPKAVSELKVANNVVQQAPKVANGAHHAIDFVTKGQKPSILKGLSKPPLLNNPKFAPKSMPKLSPKIIPKKKIIAQIIEKLKSVAARPKNMPKKVYAQILEKEAGRIFVKKIPYIGLAAGATFAAVDAWNNDWKGVGANISSGFASIFAGPGTAISMGIDAADLIRRFKNYEDEDETKGGNSTLVSEGKAVLTSSPAISANNPTVHKKKSLNGLASAYEFNKKSFETPGVVVVNKDSEILEEVRDELVSLNAKEKEKAQKLKEAEAKAKADKSVVDPKEKISEDQKKKKEEAKSTLEKARDWSLSALKKAGEKAKAAYKSTMESMGVAIDWVKDGWNGTGNGSAGPDKYGNYDVGSGQYGSGSKKKYDSSYSGPQAKFDNFKQLDANATIAAKETGLPKKFIIAQQIQENGWGKKKLTGKNNFFNIKADSSWKGPKSLHKVWEVENGRKVWKDQWFRDYEDPQQSARDYGKFLKDNPRYKDLLGKGLTAEQAALTIAKAGYATDPDYAQKIISIMNGKTFQQMSNRTKKEGGTGGPEGSEGLDKTADKINSSASPVQMGPRATPAPSSVSPFSGTYGAGTAIPFTPPSTVGASGGPAITGPQGGPTMQNSLDASNSSGGYSGKSLAGLQPETRKRLDKLSSGKQLHIISAYRSPSYNSKVGGAKGSMHMKGKAIDITWPTRNQQGKVAFIKNAISAGFNGIGIYPGFIHVDTGKKRAWGANGSRSTLPQWAASAIGGGVGTPDNSDQGMSPEGQTDGGSMGGTSGVSASGGGAGAGFADGGSTGKSGANGTNGSNGLNASSDLSKKFGGGAFGSGIYKLLGSNSGLNKIFGNSSTALSSGLTNTLSTMLGKSSIGGQLSQTLGNMDSLPFNGLMNQINSSKGGFNSSMLSSNNALAQGMSGLGNSLGNMTGTGAGATIPYVSSVSDSSLDILRGMLGGS